MPIYAYRCPECNGHFERILKREEAETEVVECKECMKPAERILTAAHYAPIKNNGASERPNFSRRRK